MMLYMQFLLNAKNRVEVGEYLFPIYIHTYNRNSRYGHQVVLIFNKLYMVHFMRNKNKRLWDELRAKTFYTYQCLVFTASSTQLLVAYMYRYNTILRLRLCSLKEAKQVILVAITEKQLRFAVRLLEIHVLTKLYIPTTEEMQAPYIRKLVQCKD